MGSCDLNAASMYDILTAEFIKCLYVTGKAHVDKTYAHGSFNDMINLRRVCCLVNGALH